MKKKVFIISALCAVLLFYGKEANAIFDPMATVESALELKDEIVTQVQEVQKFKQDMEKRIKQGYAMATSCFKNPTKCGFESLASLSNDGFKTIKVFPMMPGAVELLEQDLTNIKSEDINEKIRKTYIYKSGKDSLNNLKKNREGINSVVADQSAILFAKGAMMKTRLEKEDSAAIYQDPSAENKVDSIKYSQSKLDITSNVRLARILEIKAYMHNAQSTAELMQQSTEDK